MQSKVASPQYSLSPADLQLVLALTRARTYAGAGVRLGVDPSTVFRALQRLEKALGTTLFVRGRSGCTATELAGRLATHAERIEAELESAHMQTRTRDTPVEGRVRITSTDLLLHHLVLPALAVLSRKTPLLSFDLLTGYELANLSRRDADIAVRATRKPPGHLVGRPLGPIREAVFGRRNLKAARTKSAAIPDDARWVVIDEALPQHPSSRWRKRHHGSARVVMQAGNFQTAMDAVAAGIGIGILPIFVAQAHPDLVQLSPPIADCETQLWLLTHPESRHIRSIATVYRHLGETMALP